MAGKLTHQEEVDQARLRLRLMAEKLELEAELARSRARAGSGFTQLLEGSGGPLPRLAVTAGGAALALLAGVLLARKPGLRAPALALLARLLAR